MALSYFVCWACDDEGMGRGNAESLQERRRASGWTERPNLYATARWREAPKDRGGPGTMEWKRPTPSYVSPEEEKRRDDLRSLEYGDLAPHPDTCPCEVCERASKRLVRRVTR